MRQSVEQYVRNCDICRRSNTPRHAPFGVLQSLGIQERPWQEITMDFVTGLPDCEGFDAILVVVDRLTKMRHFSACRTDCSAEDLADLFLRHIFRLHGLPEVMVSDRGPCNVRGRGSLSHYLVYSESPSRWCSLAIILLIYLHHNLLLVSNRSIQNTYRLVILVVLTLLSLSCSLERFAFVYHVNISKTRYTVTPEFHHHVRNRENGHTWFDCTPENRV
jgi:hypothetical protein